MRSPIESGALLSRGLPVPPLVAAQGLVGQGRVPPPGRAAVTDTCRPRPSIELRALRLANVELLAARLAVAPGITDHEVEPKLVLPTTVSASKESVSTKKPVDFQMTSFRRSMHPAAAGRPARRARLIPPRPGPWRRKVRARTLSALGVTRRCWIRWLRCRSRSAAGGRWFRGRARGIDGERPVGQGAPWGCKTVAWGSRRWKRPPRTRRTR